MRWALACASLLLWSAPALAADRLSGSCGNVSAELLRYGLAAGTLAETVADEGGATAAGVFWNMTDIRLVEPTDRIPLRDGSIMYLQFKAAQRSTNVREIPLRVVFGFPPPGMTEPGGATHAQSEHVFWLPTVSNAGSDESYWTFADQYPFEMIAGTWTWQLFTGDCLLLEKSFDAYRPQP